MTDYKDTVFLPETAFPMRGNLPQREPEILATWAAQNLDQKLLAHNAGAEKFILHDGPPYANGHLHIGHALNKILKDVICRHQRMLGRHVPYVPGWDCHGLPIEWKIEEDYRKAKKNKDDVPAVQFRQECRDYAAKWVDVQAGEFQRLGVSGDWQNPYLTMDFAAEAQIVRELHTFLQNGTLYQGFKPVQWSVVEQTALAEAEVEYHDKESTQVYVRFPVVSSPVKELNAPNTSIVIWTTTPWTLPANAAVACNPELDYAVIEVMAVAEGSLAVVGERLVLATALVESVCRTLGVVTWAVLRDDVRGWEITGKYSQTLCRHVLPFSLEDDGGRLLVTAEFVTADQGTGFVHIAPAHGEDDFQLSYENNIDLWLLHISEDDIQVKQALNRLKDWPQVLQKNGQYRDFVPEFSGLYVINHAKKQFDKKTEGKILDILKEKDVLLYQGVLNHSYPHSWRSNAPLIYWATPQWFITLNDVGHSNEEDAADLPSLREIALPEIDAIRFFPRVGQNRLRAMIETRPDWCVSRQRVWGVPIMLLVHQETGEPLKDSNVLDRIAALVEQQGCDIWFDDAVIAQVLAGTEYQPQDYTRVTDILDVWFDSGSTHAFVLEQREELRKPADQRPADLYLEGSDQHRGWFQSSLLESCGTRGRAPYDAVLTHGFVLDEQGRKMSKSLGNVVAPQDVIAKYGADILRLWVISSDYYGDLRIGPAILEHHADLYRRLRNTLRYILGSLKDFSPAEAITDPKDLPELEQAVLHRLSELDQLVRKAREDYSFHALYSEIHQFCAVDLSAFYFDIRKDALYCDGADSLRRRAARTVLRQLFECLTVWLAPVLCFTAEEAWQAGAAFRDAVAGGADSVHLQPMPTLPANWQDPALAARWQQVRQVRRVVLAALERARAEKRIGASLQATPEIYISGDYAQALHGLDLAEICITSGATVLPQDKAPADAFTLPDVPGVAVVAALATGEKCVRCWQVLPEVGTDAAHAALCNRCATVVTSQKEAA
jgi:isoleucyl-tRNA synthetase